jgi:hypothetical protein
VKSQGAEVLLSLTIGNHTWNIKMKEAPIFINDPVCNIYRGELTNTSASYSRVYLHISDDYFYGYIYDGDKRFRITSPPTSLSTPISQEFLLYETQKTPPIVQNPIDCTINIELAVEVDWLLYNKVNQILGGNASYQDIYNYCQPRIESLLAKTTNFYDSYFPGFQIYIVGILVRDEPNGYSYSNTSFGGGQAANYWDNFQWCAPRDGIMLFSGHGFVFLGKTEEQICIDGGRSASAIRAINGLPDVDEPSQMSFTVAHELGHQLNVPHLEPIEEINSFPCVEGSFDCTTDLMCAGSLAVTIEDATLSQCSYDRIVLYQTEHCDCVGDEPVPVSEFPCPSPDIFDIRIMTDNLHPVAGCNRDEVTSFEIEVQWIGQASVDADLKFSYSALYEEIIQTDQHFNNFQTAPGGAYPLEWYESTNPVTFQPGETKTFFFKSKLIDGVNNPPTGTTALFFEVEKPQVGTEQYIFNKSVQLIPAVDFIHGNNWVAGEPKLFSILLDEYLNNGLFPPAFSEGSNTPVDIEVVDHLEIDLDNLRWGDWGNTSTPDVYSYSFNNMTFKLATDARIVVTGAGEVNFNSCKFVSCEEMWNSIEIGPDAKVFVNNCEIENAKKAITLGSGAEASITNNDFRNNYIGLATKGGSISNPTDLQFFYGNTITQTDYLFPPYSGEKAYAGIVAEDVNDLSIGFLDKAPNEFKKIKNGVLAYNTNLTVFNSLFKNINAWDETQPLPQEPVKGTYAIYANTSWGKTRTLRVIGFGKYETPMFSNCQSAVGFKGMVGKVKQCNMQNVVFGVSAFSNQYRVFDVSDNRIEATGIGINLTHNTPSQGRIIGNEIFVNDNLGNLDRAVGIKVSENTNTIAKYNYYDILDNTINLKEGKAGIEMLAGKYIELGNNTINLEYDRKQSGIYTAGSTRALIKCNTINGPGSSLLTEESKAIDVFSTYSSVVSCNNTSGTYFGLDFNGSDDDIHLKGNNLHEHKVGLQIEETGAIGSQEHRGNRWYGPFDSWGARHLALPNIVVQSQFFVDGNASTGESYNFLPSQIESSDQWFIPESASNGTFYCEIETVNYCDETGDAWEIKPGDNEDIFDVVSGTDYDDLGNALAWNNGNHEYEQFHEVYNEIKADSLSDIRNINQDEIPELYGVKHSTGELMEVDANTHDNILSHNKQVDEALNAVKQNSQDIIAGVSGAEGLRTSLLNQLEDKITTRDNYLGAFESSVLSGLPGIVSSNQNISSTETYIQNEQRVNYVYLETVAKGIAEIPAMYHATLWGIASQCPLTGGEAVFKARSLYSLIDPLVAYDDDVICQGVSLFQRETEAVETIEPAFKVFPNPASEYIVVQLEDIRSESVNIEILNTYGQVIKKEFLGTEKHVIFIDTDWLEEGIYFCRVNMGENSIGTQKFILIK